MLGNREMLAAKAKYALKAMSISSRCHYVISVLLRTETFILSLMVGPSLLRLILVCC